MVKLNFGVSVIPRIAVRNEEGKTLSVKQVFSKDECRTIGIVFKKSSAMKLSAKAFIEVIDEYFKDVEII